MKENRKMRLGIRRLYLSFLFVLFVALFSVNANAQDKTVLGKVVENETNEPLIGVSVYVKGTTQGVSTDAEGKYSISNVPENATLVFTLIGMTSQEFLVKDKTTINVSMSTNTIGLNEVVAFGYGTVKKSDITGAVVSLKSEDLTVLPSQRADEALQGKAAGVMVINTDAAPGGNVKIRVRGMNSIQGGNDALIVVDGLQGGDLTTINPNDIESMEVLKDASATAIYGSRGANGVILITTKSGKKGKPSVSYSYNFGVQNIRKTLELLGPADYARNVNAYLAVNDAAGPVTPAFSDAEIAELEKTDGTDWQDEIYDPALMRNHQLSVNGGNDNTTYYFSGAYLNQDGILINTGYERLNFRAIVDTKINNWFETGLNLSLIKTVGTVSPFGESVSFQSNPILVATRWGSNLTPYDENGNYTKHPTRGYGPVDTWNPVASALEVETENRAIENSVGAYMNFNIIDGLTFRVSGWANYVNRHPSYYYNSLTREGQPQNGLVGWGRVSSTYWQNLQNTNTLTYKKDIGKHSFTATGVYEQSSQSFSYEVVQASQFTVDLTGLNDLAGAKLTTNNSSSNKKVIQSALGRLAYVYDGKYMLTATYRADGSSVFGKNNKWGYFPSAAVAWRISEEGFMDDIAQVSNLKLRASYGTTGNQAIGSYNTLAAITSGWGSFYDYPYNGQETKDLGLRITRAANPNLKWESTAQLNLGLDIGFFEGRLSSTIDAYSKKTDNLLLDRALPGYSGLYSMVMNVGSTENKGLEISVSGDPFVGEFKWNTGFNISWNENMITDLGGSEKIKYSSSLGGYGVNDLIYLEEGESFGNWYGYQYLGTWKESEREEAALYGQLPGSARYADLDKDTLVNINDIGIIGNSLPKFIYGWTNKFSYKNFDLNVLIQGTYGNQIFNQGRIRLEVYGEGNSIRMLDRWTIDNQDTDIPALIPASEYQASGLKSKYNLGASDNATTRFVEDGSYLRIKNITLGYNIPQNVLSKIKLNMARIYVSGTNLLTFTKYTGYDPEVSTFNGNDVQLGVDLGNYPTAKTYSVGLDIRF